jgi:hypothetical protein
MEVLSTNIYVPRLLASTCEEVMTAIQEDRVVDFSSIRVDDPRTIGAYEHLSGVFTPPTCQ